MAGLRLDRKHFPGVIKNGSGRFYFGPRPTAVAEGAERRRFFSRANIARNEVGLLKRNIELRVIGKLEREHLLAFICSGPESIRGTI